ncbi:folliculin-interacting protein 1 isoform X2 [Euwallacea similis]|uniref:folliculin-interacting protein 1 isoform X2 n=1 Tax=Euwallacea similis TaxID=1736056 RepID=UPI00344D8920
MALLNKLFSGCRNAQQNSKDDSTNFKVPTISKEKVRLVLFRECDFRGRKLLFDSDATKKVPLEKTEADEKFVEIYDGFGYLVISKQNSDYHQLSEMIFGSVAMSFRGAYLKIHSLSSPCRMMFTQVFPSPHGRITKSSSASSNQSHLSSHSSFEHSIKLDDSGANSALSISDRLSDRSTASDTVLVCRRLQSSPLDVPGVGTSLSKNSLVVDSGCAGQSFFGASTGSLNFPTWESLFSSKVSFSSSGILKRLLRNTTRSLHNSSISLPNSSDVLHKKGHKGVKLGLSFVIEISQENETFLTQVLMEHIVLLEALICRTRRSIEIAYQRRTAFISLMVELTHNASTWLMSFLNTQQRGTNLWQSLSFTCDNNASINAFIMDCNNRGQTMRRTLRYKFLNGSNSDNKYSRSDTYSNGLQTRHGSDLFSFNFSRFLKSGRERTEKVDQHLEGDFVAEEFLRQFCELLEGFDAKHTNFFISTLLTAILTHHLGWVATVYSSHVTSYQDFLNYQPYNALWSQLADLYGAVGYPLKTAQTVITGSNKNDLISKLLASLTYFIRFAHIERKDVRRCSVEEENKVAEIICIKDNCLPKENFKRYEDHLKELLKSGFSPSVDGVPKIVNIKENWGVNGSAAEMLKPAKSLMKTKSTVALSGLLSSDKESVLNGEEEPFLRHSSTLEALNDISEEGNFIKFCPNGKDEMNTGQVKSIQENKTELEKDICESEDQRNVIFVLGENEKLIGLKKEDQLQNSSNTSISSGAKRKISAVKRPSSVNLTVNKTHIENKPTEHSNCRLHPSSSCEELCSDKIKPPETSIKAPPSLKLRAQSEPPEIRKILTPKYQHSRVKFNLQQYPQVVKNYMKSKNIELEGLSLGEKVFDKFATVQQNIKLDLSEYESDSEEVEALQTPSNASELEFSPDMGTSGHGESSFSFGTNGALMDMKIINIPMPKSIISDNHHQTMPYTTTVMKGLVDTYMPDMVLQGTTHPKNKWDSKLKSNLAMSTQHSLLDSPIDEALAIVANTDTWEVQVISSHTYVIDKGTNGVRVGMSQLVANMLESLLEMWKLRIAPKYCILHIEQRLQELCVRSKALAELLLACEFCSIELLTSRLSIEVNDVPLLMAVASTHTPEVTRKYGLSFQ